MTAARIFELLAAALFIALSAAVLWDVHDMPPPMFGTIGSGDLPWTVGWLVIVLSLGIALRAALAGPPPQPEGKARAAPWRILAVLVLTGAYAGVVDWGRVDFGLTSMIYLCAMFALLLRRRSYATWALALAVGGVVAFGCDALFTHVLFIDLP